MDDVIGEGQEVLWREIGWDHVERMRAEVPPLAMDRLTGDAMEPVEDNLRRILDYIAA